MRRAQVARFVIPALTFFIVGFGCVSYAEHRWPTYDLAVSLGPQIEEPAIVRPDALPKGVPLVVYVSIHGDFPNWSQESQAKHLMHRVLRSGHNPDLVAFVPQGGYHAGSVHQYWGFGLSTTTPEVRQKAVAHCYRIAPARLGIRTNEQGMVTWVDEEQRTLTGLLEGDTVISVNGHEVLGDEHRLAPVLAEMLRLTPGQPLRFVWIRPGTGRMEGEGTAQSAPPLPKDILSLVPARESLPSVQRNR